MTLPTPMPAGLQIAADRPEGKNYSVLRSDIGTGINSEVPHTFANGTGRYLLLTYDNWGVQSNGRDTPNPNPVTFQGALHEPDGSSYYQARFIRIRHDDGTTTEFDTPASSVTVPGGDSADAIVDLGVSRPAGTRLIERCFAGVNTGEVLVLHRSNGTTCFSGVLGEVSTISVNEQPKTLELAPLKKPAISTYGIWASSIRHVDPPAETVQSPTIVVGDSLAAANYGWRKALHERFHVPQVSIASSGESAHTFLTNDSRTHYRRKLAALGGFDKAVVQYFTNDLILKTPAQTTTLFKSELNSLLSLLASWGVPVERVIVGTLPPNTESIDYWSTLAGQSLPEPYIDTRAKNQQTLLDYNAWLRTGTKVYLVVPSTWRHSNGFYVADVGGSVTTMSSSVGDVPEVIAKWSTPSGAALTGDGLHPGTATGTKTWSNAVPSAFFQA